ncbi:helicase, partial [Phlyctochytrium bullatum]
MALTERKSFKDLLSLCNKDVASLLVKRNATANHTTRIHLAYQSWIRKKLQGQQFIAFTQDAWTSPNQKAFMAVTVHFLTEDFVMHDFVLGLRKIE